MGAPLFCLKVSDRRGRPGRRRDPRCHHRHRVVAGLCEGCRHRRRGLRCRRWAGCAEAPLGARHHRRGLPGLRWRRSARCAEVPLGVPRHGPACPAPAADCCARAIAAAARAWARHRRGLASLAPAAAGRRVARQAPAWAAPAWAAPARRDPRCSAAASAAVAAAAHRCVRQAFAWAAPAWIALAWVDPGCRGPRCPDVAAAVAGRRYARPVPAWAAPAWIALAWAGPAWRGPRCPAAASAVAAVPAVAAAEFAAAGPGLRLLLALLRLRLLLGSLAGGRSFARGARRIVAEAALLAGGERLRRRRLGGRPDLGPRLAHHRLGAEVAIADILGADLDRARDPRRSGEDARTHLIGAQRPPDRGRHERGRQPRIDRVAPVVAEHHGPVHHHGLTHVDRIFAHRQDHADEPRGNREIADPDEGPDRGPLAIFDDDLFRRQRRPADIFLAVPPLHVAGSPFFTRHPGPSEVVIGDPAAVVIGHPAPTGLFLGLDPVPAPVLGVDPTSHRVGAPVVAAVARDPDLAPASMPLPAAVRFQRDPGLGRNRDLALALGLALRLPGTALLNPRATPLLHLRGTRLLLLHLRRRRFPLRLRRHAPGDRSGGEESGDEHRPGHAGADARCWYT